MTAAPHISVLLNEVVAGLAPKAGQIFVDGTFGAGGYSRALLDAAGCRVFGIDRDPTAVARGAELARHYDGRLTVLAGRFGDMDSLLAERGIDRVDGVALDLGVSSMQIDEAERGFSFQKDGPLDMRMEKDGTSAADMVNSLPEADLADIFWRFGEERHSRRIARAIVADRKAQPFTTTRQLAELIRRIVPRSKDGIDPATRTFQGLRIAVNDEMGEVERGLAAAERLLTEGGRLAVVSFHSLEDRAVKDFLKTRSGGQAQPSRHLPVAGEAREPSFRLLSRKPIAPGPQETAANPRARSSRLRLAERTAAAAWPSPEGHA
ncbi:16S rRNA (cytosine(1402)-N(4))-methyltransferase RsmH [Telmatospirillum siberiense]|uniref:Ribosomal RNA small subunit methyltransferase H n=1 Tax=Telmatospirillum siberiense TaxID=382514 RepID=A0A2N3PQK3_9PROT|nr:16S rRNA (cytosine(1402)-N(4))-methyltransferase RsmH [Telmatospirillum siberiense]PKU22680.1 16S rRNA (cytosine(1402)-N(4))-methyltransferase [Telmatospirillum siberiense]